ncbi:hypothetical protein M0805_003124 [Coniferiporia weirii]|nr:hypothetical protein M0805_003124 [Coniferiporia weirii]
MSGRTFYVGGNFKLNPTTQAESDAIVQNIATVTTSNEVVVAPSPLHVRSAATILAGSQKSNITVAAQNSSSEASGAFTGEISPAQIKDAGAFTVILGHSERRTHFFETSEIVAKKARLVIDTGLKVILCVGETQKQRDDGTTIAVIKEQLDPVIKLLKPEEWSPNVVIAYEPVWAIGTGLVATSAQAQDVHAAIREYLSGSVSTDTADRTRIIYGGSVTAANCHDLAIQRDIDGFLVGGASLKPGFAQIINCNNAN